MGAAELKLLAERRAFRPRTYFLELVKDHVSFDTLGAGSPEEQVRCSLAAEGGVIAVIGPSGAGKSSLIAAVAATVAGETFVPLRIGVANAESHLQDPIRFAQHVIREVLQLADDILGDDREVLEPATAASRTELPKETTTRVGGRLSTGLFAGEVARQVKTQAESLIQEANPTDSAAGLDQVVQIFGHHGLKPILLFEDTDAWVGREEMTTTASAFFERLTQLARQLNIRVLVAVHPEYQRLDGFRAIEDVLLDQVKIPVFPDAAVALKRILQHYIKRVEIHSAVEEVIEHDAVVWLGSQYDSDHDLRRVLNLVDRALRRAGAPLPDRLGVEHLRFALAQPG